MVNTTDDNMAEAMEEFTINFMSANQEVAAIEYSTVSVSIEDDDCT